MDSSSTDSYWAAGDLEPMHACGVCLTSRVVPLYDNLEDMEEGVPGSWRMIRCLDCDSITLDPRPRPAAIGKAYRSYYTHLSPDQENASYSGSGPIWHWMDGYIFHRFGDRTRASSWLGAVLVSLVWPLRQQLDYLYRHLPAKSGALLDIGSGNGAFMLRARNAGWAVKGVEPDAVAAEQALRCGLDVLVGDCSGLAAGESFDVITMAHVIEHLHDPSVMLFDCYRLLKPGGRLWIATPNIRSTGHRLFGAAWQPLEVPRHLVMPSAEALAKALQDAGFTNIRFHRRGRGSRKRIQASVDRAGQMGLRSRSAAFWSVLVDVRASLLPLAAEELVVTADRPVSG